MREMRAKEFCKAVAQACHDGLLTKQQAKTLIGQAKHDDLKAAMMGLQTLVER